MEENDKKKSVKFKFTGITNNDPVEVEDKNKEKGGGKKRMLKGPGLPPGAENVDPEVLNSLMAGIFDVFGITPDRVADLEDELNGIGIEIKMKKADEDDESENDGDIFNLGNIKILLDPESFWKIPCRSDSELHEKFVKKFGETGIGIDDFGSSMKCNMNGNLKLGDLETFKIIDYTNRYVLLYGNSYDDSEEGAFIAVIENPDGEYEIVIPSYGNTYKIETGELFSIDRDPEAFTKDGRFAFNTIEKVEAGLDVLLVPVKNPLMTPKKFGILKPALSSIEKGYGNKIRIGILESNESADAMMLKKDFDLPTDKTKFDFYLRFNESADDATLSELAILFNKIDFNNSLIFEQSELKVSGEDLFIDVNLGSLLENLQEWYGEDGNSK